MLLNRMIPLSLLFLNIGKKTGAVAYHKRVLNGSQDVSLQGKLGPTIIDIL